jgi:hypothetical protein
MGLWKAIEQALLTGRIIQEYGRISQGWRWGQRLTTAAMLTERRGVDRFVIKTTNGTHQWKYCLHGVRPPGGAQAQGCS